jgi:L-ascorbate metabolism protein UlaG (beta-lactamase superfamily)
MNPEQAVAAHCDVNPVGADTADDDTPQAALATARRSVMLPVHWATFNLAMHWWSEPIRRALRAARAVDVPVIAPRVGERVDVAAADPASVADQFSEAWWTVAAGPDDHD